MRADDIGAQRLEEACIPRDGGCEGELKTHTNHHVTQKPARVGVRVDDIGAKRLEETCIPRDGGSRGGVHGHANNPAIPKTETEVQIKRSPFI